MPSDDDHPRTVQVDVHIDAETWRRIAQQAVNGAEHGQDPASAYRDAVQKYVTTAPSLVVDGEVRGPEDIDGLPLPTQEGHDGD
jgi:hypothetical protein